MTFQEFHERFQAAVAVGILGLMVLAVLFVIALPVVFFAQGMTWKGIALIAFLWFWGLAFMIPEQEK